MIYPLLPDLLALHRRNMQCKVIAFTYCLALANISQRWRSRFLILAILLTNSFHLKLEVGQQLGIRVRRHQNIW
jgi:hypothetical protein